MLCAILGNLSLRVAIIAVPRLELMHAQNAPFTTMIYPKKRFIATPVEYAGLEAEKTFSIAIRADPAMPLTFVATMFV